MAWKSGYVEKVKAYDLNTWKEKGSIFNWFAELEISLGSSWLLDALFCQELYSVTRSLESHTEIFMNK